MVNGEWSMVNEVYNIRIKCGCLKFLSKSAGAFDIKVGSRSSIVSGHLAKPISIHHLPAGRQVHHSPLTSLIRRTTQRLSLRLTQPAAVLLRFFFVFPVAKERDA